MRPMLNDGFRKFKLPLLGRGSYSQVFELPKHPNLVLKNCSQFHDYWPLWIIWAHKHGYTGNWAPAVKNISFKRRGYCAVMERLKYDPSATDYLYPYNFEKFELDAAGQSKFLEAIKQAQWVSDCNVANCMRRECDGMPVLTDPQNRGALAEPKVGGFIGHIRLLDNGKFDVHSASSEARDRIHDLINRV